MKLPCFSAEIGIRGVDYIPSLGHFCPIIIFHKSSGLRLIVSASKQLSQGSIKNIPHKVYSFVVKKCLVSLDSTTKKAW